MTMPLSRGPRELNRDLVNRFRQSVSRRLAIELRPCQVIAATHLLGPSIAEMRTGEGKTLAVALASAHRAHQTRNRVLVVTANDYLARRDADWMSNIYQDLGLRVTAVTADSTSSAREVAYNADVTYGTLREFAFDFLKQSLAKRQGDPPTHSSSLPLDSLIIDEADSVLIDEARMPMVISAATGTLDDAAEACYRWSGDFARNIRPIDYVVLPELQSVALTYDGRRRMLHSTMPPEMRSLSTTEILHAIERAIWVNVAIHSGVHYIVSDGGVFLVDELTGRKSDQRAFGGGIQQAVQAREGLRLTPESQPVARMTVQDFVHKFAHLSGITATAWEERSELRQVYGLSVQRVPSHVPSRRVTLPIQVAQSTAHKWDMIVQETKRSISAGRCVLVGTRTIDESERLSELFAAQEVEHQVLNARYPQREAAIIAAAGNRMPDGLTGRVTIATNMAGRGTDIPLSPLVTSAGGLHVIAGQPHAARRIDRQLEGRSGRQGDPGTTRLFVGPEDDILVQAWGQPHADKIREHFQAGASEAWLISRVFRAQRFLQRRHRHDRARIAAHEAGIMRSLKQLSLDPYLNPLPTNY